MGAPLSHWKSVDALDSGGRIPPLVFAFLRGIVRVNLECRLIELLVWVTRQKLTAGLRIAHVHFDSCLVKQLTQVKCRNLREKLCTRYLCALRLFVFPMVRTTANNGHWETGQRWGKQFWQSPGEKQPPRLIDPMMTKSTSGQCMPRCDPLKFIHWSSARFCFDVPFGKFRQVILLMQHRSVWLSLWH